jgi:hypothetical protein
VHAITTHSSPLLPLTINSIAPAWPVVAEENLAGLTTDCTLYNADLWAKKRQIALKQQRIVWIGLDTNVSCVRKIGRKEERRQPNISSQINYSGNTVTPELGQTIAFAEKYLVEDKKIAAARS